MHPTFGTADNAYQAVVYGGFVQHCKCIEIRRNSSVGRAHYLVTIVIAKVWQGDDK